MGITKLIRRSIGIMCLSLLIILIANLLLLAAVSLSSRTGGRPWTMAADTAAALGETPEGWVLEGGQSRALAAEDAWAVLVDTDTLTVKWHTDNAPDSALGSYTAGDIAMLTRGYIADCPTFPASMENGDLVVVGYPHDSYWKHMYASWDYDLIANAPKLALGLLCFNLLLVTAMYIVANSRLYKSVRPIEEGIEALPTLMGEPVRERGLLSPLAQSINRTSELLREQRRELRRRDSARAEWIRAVSHDIRTPLVMVMGYASQLQDDPTLSAENREKAGVIVRQSLRMRTLISDLNLVSHLEYDMQPLNTAPVSLVSIARECAAGFVDADVAGLWPLDWSDCGGACTVNGDAALLTRAVNNALNNCRVHNPDGCPVSVAITRGAGEYTLRVANTLTGEAKSPPSGDDGHGLGLQIISRVAKAHGGRAEITAENGEFVVVITLPAADAANKE